MYSTSSKEIIYLNKIFPPEGCGGCGHLDLQSVHPDGQVSGQEGHHQGTVYFTVRVSDLHLTILMAKFPDRKATIKVLHTLQCVYPTCTWPSWWPISQTGRPPSRYFKLSSVATCTFTCHSLWNRSWPRSRPKRKDTIRILTLYNAATWMILMSVCLAFNKLVHFRLWHDYCFV